MDRNNYIDFNPLKCEPYLSNLGKQVLQVLVQQYARRNVQKERLTQEGYQNRSGRSKVLNFNDESLSTSTVTAQPSLPIISQNNEKINNLKINDDISEIHSSSELVKTFQTYESSSDGNIIYIKNFSEIFYKECDDGLQKVTHTKNCDNNVGDNPPNDVGWDNMFDLESFDDMPTDKFISNNQNDNTHIAANVMFNDNSSNIFNDTTHAAKLKNYNEIVKSRTIKKAKITHDKSLNAQKLCDGGEKCSFRKQKYTKSVKNWLHDVDIRKELDTEHDCDTNNNNKKFKIEHKIDQRIDNKTDDDIIRKITIDKTIKCIKKTVQAQLANKDGKMKFSKPKRQIEIKSIDENNISSLKNKTEKVTKKFIPPIKYPVKDITYEVITVDDKIIDKVFFEDLNLNENPIDNLSAMLICRNGYCQLNSDFSDGSCTTDGVLLCIGDKFFYFKGTGENIRKTLGRLIENNTIIAYEARSILIYFSSHLQMDISKICVYDVKIGANLLDPDHPPENFNDLQKLISVTPQFTIATECMFQKTAWYMTILKECWLKLKDILIENQLWKVFAEIEMKLLPIIAKMEYRGISIDMVKLKYMEEALLARMKSVEQECYKAAGKMFQINSTSQVRCILYDELKLDTKCNVKITETLTTGVKSTSETMLRSLMSVHPLPKLILEYRHLHKAHATFLAGIAQHVNDGIVRPVWVQTAAATGRIASNNPNLQAIPKVAFSLVMFPDAENRETLQVNFRSVYVSRAGHKLLAADFQHVECRVFAHAAADSELLRALARCEDLFRVLAAHWLNKCEQSVSPGERERTKRLVYASLYGAGVRKLMDILNVSYEQALQVTASFNRTFPSLKSFGRQVVSRCSSSGGRLSTILGRVRHFSDITSEDFSLRSHAERQAVNFVVQGSAADLCKTAMILTEKEFRNSSPPVEAFLLLQIHDELVWEVHDNHVEMAAGIIKRVMEGCGRECGMSISLPVTISVGNNWADMEKYHLI